MKTVILRDFKEDCRDSMENYADQLAKGLSNLGSKLVVQNFTPQIPAWLRFIKGIPLMQMRAARYLLYPKQAKKLKADIFHIVDHGYAHLVSALPPSNVVITVHDLIPLLGWKGLIQGYPKTKRPLLVEYSLSYLARANRLIADSESTKRDLILHLGCKAEKIEVVYPGLDNIFYQATKEEQKELRKSFELPEMDCKFILVTGAVKYKNNETSLKVLKLLNEQCKKPVMMIRLGAPYEEWNDKVKNAGLEKLTRVIHSLSRKRVADLYNCADCLLFPSTYEGFGWPPLEAMACGVPVVASNAASLPEIIGDAGLIANPHDVEVLTNLTLQALDNSSARKFLIEKGLERASKFKWEKSIKRIVEIYDEVLLESKSR
ncbi:MAG: glycosyltransferase family 4 protein [Candidatus Riflebacteria bacterium]|nr:glycosyltransferase family 4 protein [Candidatus Riflebacteria bacterium]